MLLDLYIELFFYNNNLNNINNNKNNYIYQESNNAKIFLRYNNSYKKEGANSPKCFQNKEKKIDEYKQIDPWELYRIFHNSITHILFVKSLFGNLKHIPLRKMELYYLEKDLDKNGYNYKEMLKGCLDWVNNIK